MSARRPQRRKLMSDINVVPYIDVMLVLLVIFMVTAPLLTQGVKVELPKAAATAVEGPQEAFIVTVDDQGRYSFSHGKTTTENLPLDALRREAKAALQITPATPMLVRGDRRVSYEHVIAALAALRQAGAASVGLVTEPTTGKAAR